MRHKMTFHFKVLLSLIVLGTGCQTTIPKEALKMDGTTLEFRKMQSRRYDTADETKVIVATAGLLQDFGFNIDESETKLGLVVGSKARTAVDGGQIAAKVVLAALFGANMAIDKDQRIKASVVTKKTGAAGKEHTMVRVTFQRIVRNEYNQITRLEALNEPKQYQDFFTALSKALFLNANDI